MASYTDIARFSREHSELFAKKAKRTVVMGGAMSAVSDTVGRLLRLLPDDAHNNTMGKDASREFFDACQDLRIPMVMVSRHAAGACHLARNFYDELAATGSPVGIHMQQSAKCHRGTLATRHFGRPEEAKGAPRTL